MADVSPINTYAAFLQNANVTPFPNPGRCPGLVCMAPLALYRPRDPRASALWCLMDQHFPTFQHVYDERFQAKYGFWRPVIDRSVTAFLKCGDLHEGFARVRCPDCQYEMFVDQEDKIGPEVVENMRT